LRAPADDVPAALVRAGDIDVPSSFAHSTHNTPPEETFTNVIDRPSVDYLHLDHRLREPLHTDLFPSTPASPTCATTFGDPALDPTPDLGIASDSGIHTTISTANASIVPESTENAVLISSDHLAILNGLTQGAEPLFNCQNKSAEGLPNCQSLLYRGRLSIRLLRSIGEHAPFTTFSIVPPETFPTKKLATSNAVRSLLNMHPEFQGAIRNYN